MPLCSSDHSRKALMTKRKTMDSDSLVGSPHHFLTECAEITGTGTLDDLHLIGCFAKSEACGIWQFFAATVQGNEEIVGTRLDGKVND